MVDEFYGYNGVNDAISPLAFGIFSIACLIGIVIYNIFKENE